MNRNYLVLHPNKGSKDIYTVRMLDGKQILGLLCFYEKRVDGNSLFYYDITSKQPLNRIAERKKLSEKEIRTLITDLVLVLKEMERYLLDECQICLKPEYLYLEPESFHISLCLIPGYEGNFSENMLDLAQYILDHVDQGDGEAVILAFSLFQTCRKDNFGILDLENCLGVKAERKIERNTENPCKISLEKHEKPSKIKMQQEYEKVSDAKEKSVEKNKTNLFIRIFSSIKAAIHSVFDSDLNSVEERLDHELWEEEFWEFDYSKSPERSEDSIEEKRSQPDESKGDPYDDMQTVLLSTVPSARSKRRLIAIESGKEIVLSYFPFLIGKSRQLADCCLEEAEISRLHAKIEEKEGRYFITDLNSTNGTKLNQELLEANETRELKVGDEVTFAVVSFLFR